MLYSIQTLGFAGQGGLGDSGNVKKGSKSTVILLFPDKACICAFALGVGKGQCCFHKNQKMTICSGAFLTWCQLAIWAAVQASVERFWDETVLQTVPLHVILMTSLQHLAVVLDSELIHLYALVPPGIISLLEGEQWPLYKHYIHGL